MAGGVPFYILRPDLPSASEDAPMTEVLFYHLESRPLEQVLPQLLEKTLERGWRAVVQAGSDERAAALSQV